MSASAAVTGEAVAIEATAVTDPTMPVTPATPPPASAVLVDAVDSVETPASTGDDLFEHAQIFVEHARQDAHAEGFWDANKNKWGYSPVHKPIDAEGLRRHLNCRPPVGVYFIPAGSNVTRLAALDLDDHDGVLNWDIIRQAAASLLKIGKQFGLEASPVRSGGGKGAHLWYRWDIPQRAAAVRDRLLTLVAAAGFKSGAGGIAKHQIEIFPKQSEIAAEGFGNLLAVPFGRKSEPLDSNLQPTPVPMDWISSAPVPALRPEHINQPVVDADPNTVRDALKSLAADDYGEWIRIGLGLKHSLGDAGFDLWDVWSQTSRKYPGRGAIKKQWDTFRPRPDGVTVGTIFHVAREAGWQGQIARYVSTPNGIVMQGGELNSILDEAEDALLAAGVHIYQRGELVRLCTVNEAKSKKKADGIARAEGSTILAPVNDRWLQQKMAQSVSWYKVNSKGKTVPADPNLEYARHLLARQGEWPFPVLTGLLSAPTLDRDGRIIQQPGFDPASGLHLNFAAGLFPDVPECPTLEVARGCMAKLDRLLRGFPFDSAVSRSVALSAILTSLIRPSIRTAPIHGFDAPAAGSGKSMLAEVTGIIATGNLPAAMSQGKDDEEDEKRLSVVLRAGDPVIWIDNCERPLQGDFLCSMVTQETVQARILGKSERVLLPSKCLVVATGNNLEVVGDVTRRVITCRVDAGVERPDTREFDFDCRDEARTQRPELIVAALTALLAYRISGEKVRLQPMGSFSDWEWVRGTLVWTGFADPAKSRDEIVASDSRTDVLADLMEAWDLVNQDNPVKVKAMEVGSDSHAETPRAKLALALIDASGQNRWNARAIGAYLRHNRGRIVRGRRFTGKESGGRSIWRLEWVKELPQQKSLDGI